MNTNKKEELINRFIDDLNEEKKPNAYKSNEFDSDDEKMFETIRSIKRTRKKKNRILYLKKKVIKLGSIAAAAVLIFILISGVFEIPNKINDDKIVHAVVKAYNEMRSYKGKVEIIGTYNGVVETYEIFDIKYKKPFKYKAVHKYNGITREKYSDGNQLVLIEPQGISIDKVFPEKELWRYHIGVPIWSLENAEEIVEIGEDAILGREALYLEYRYDGMDDYNKIWIDKETKLPLKNIIVAGNMELVRKFIDFEVNPDLNDKLFDYEIATNENIEYLNQVGEIGDIKDISSIDIHKLLSSIPQEFTLKRIGVFDDNHIYNYVLRFRRKDDYIDLYYKNNPETIYNTDGAELGKINNSYVISHKYLYNIFDMYFGSNSLVSVISKDFELGIVSNLKPKALEKIVESFMDDSIKPIT